MPNELDSQHLSASLSISQLFKLCCCTAESYLFVWTLRSEFSFRGVRHLWSRDKRGWDRSVRIPSTDSFAFMLCMCHSLVLLFKFVNNILSERCIKDLEHTKVRVSATIVSRVCDTERFTSFGEVKHLINTIVDRSKKYTVDQLLIVKESGWASDFYANVKLGHARQSSDTVPSVSSLSCGEARQGIRS